MPATNNSNINNYNTNIYIGSLILNESSLSSMLVLLECRSTESRPRFHITIFQLSKG